MSKTFKSAGNPEAAISVVPSADGVRTVHVHGIEASGVTVPREDAPALALAILEAAVGESSRQSAYSERAIDNLRAEVDRMKLEDAEAEAQAELEAEALELRNAWARGNCAQINEFSYLTEEAQENWLAVARRAREINKEEK